MNINKDNFKKSANEILKIIQKKKFKNIDSLSKYIINKKVKNAIKIKTKGDNQKILEQIDCAIKILNERKN